MVSSIDRRTFLRSAISAGVATTLGHGAASPKRSSAATASPKRPQSDARKLILVVFGGGTRSSETIEDPQHRYIPHLWNEMIPRGALLTNMRVEHRVVHPNSTGSILTGHWEWDDIDWSKPVSHPTIFEVYRKARRAPDPSAWAFVYASILAKAGHSLAPGYDASFGANVVEPPTIPRSTAEEMDRLMHAAATTGGIEAQLQAARRCEQLTRSTSRITHAGLRSDAARTFLHAEYDAWKSGHGTTSHDAFLTDRAIASMRQFAPDVITVAYGEIDCAHYGSWSRYVEAIRRTDELTHRLWQTAETLDAYRGRTLMLILPDHGRELDAPDRWGFIHHSDFYTNQGADEGCRRVWMLAIAPGVRAGRRLACPIPITTAASTGLDYLGLSASPGAAPSALPLIA
ncbi:MAG: hypothetical protein JXQ73_12245 [Phycisphaerae bacterium]|nr:hypothetical protein [Phycisphaerae bacterium]